MVEVSVEEDTSQHQQTYTERVLSFTQKTTPKREKLAERAFGARTKSNVRYHRQSLCNSVNILPVSECVLTWQGKCVDCKWANKRKTKAAAAFRRDYAIDRPETLTTGQQTASGWSSGIRTEKHAFLVETCLIFILILLHTCSVGQPLQHNQSWESECANQKCTSAHFFKPQIARSCLLTSSSAKVSPQTVVFLLIAAN